MSLDCLHPKTEFGSLLWFHPVLVVVKHESVIDGLRNVIQFEIMTVIQFVSENEVQLRFLADYVDSVEIQFRLENNEQTHIPHKPHKLSIFIIFVFDDDLRTFLLPFEVVLEDIHSFGQGDPNHRI